MKTIPRMACPVCVWALAILILVSPDHRPADYVAVALAALAFAMFHASLITPVAVTAGIYISKGADS